MKASRAVVWLAAAWGQPAFAQVTSRASVDSNEVQGNDYCYLVAISDDGRYVAFDSDSSNLVPGDTNGFDDVFVRDRVLGTTERASVDSLGMQGNGSGSKPAISADGRYVAFESAAGNLVVGDSNLRKDVFVRDRQSGTTERVSVASSGAQGDDESRFASISADGRYVAFYSAATNLVPGDSNTVWDIFVRDRQSGTTERASVDTSGAQANGFSYLPSISSDGRYVAFASIASNLAAGDTNGFEDIYVRDRLSGTTERASVDSGEVQGNNYSLFPSISGDGRYVAYWSFASNLVAGDTNGTTDVFVRDRTNGTTERASIATAGTQGNGGSGYPKISGDGSTVAFESLSSNLVSGDTNTAWDIFVRDLPGGVTERVNLHSQGTQANSGSFDCSISSDLRYVAYRSQANNLVNGDTNGVWDIFVTDRDYQPMTSLCDPGAGGVIACPCSNPPGGTGRGCDNSAGTGGAILSAAGVAYLSQDTLVFTTSGEKPTALSLVTQWLGANTSGTVFGMGVRCTSSTFKRLYSKAAVGGSITAPAGGDPPVSVRSAALGDTILPGQSRRYLVHYRDQTVLGGCPATSNFNATQTGRVAWSP